MAAHQRQNEGQARETWQRVRLERDSTASERKGFVPLFGFVLLWLARRSAAAGGPAKAGILTGEARAM